MLFIFHIHIFVDQFISFIIISLTSIGILLPLLQLVEGERKAVYEDCENEKSENREKVKRLKEDIRELQGRLRDSTASSEPVLKHVQGRRHLQLNVLKKKSGEDAVEAS